MLLGINREQVNSYDH